MVKVLQLNLHREWFATIVAKTKRVEYRRRTPYWKTRLENRKYDMIQFRNGLTRSRPLSPGLYTFQTHGQRMSK